MRSSLEWLQNKMRTKTNRPSVRTSPSKSWNLKESQSTNTWRKRKSKLVNTSKPPNSSHPANCMTATISSSSPHPLMMILSLDIIRGNSPCTMWSRMKIWEGISWSVCWIFLTRTLIPGGLILIRRGNRLLKNSPNLIGLERSRLESETRWKI